MRISIACTSCNTEYEIPPLAELPASGGTVQCKRCGSEVNIPPRAALESLISPTTEKATPASDKAPEIPQAISIPVPAPAIAEDEAALEQSYIHTRIVNVDEYLQNTDTPAHKTFDLDIDFSDFESLTEDQPMVSSVHTRLARISIISDDEDETPQTGDDASPAVDIELFADAPESTPQPSPPPSPVPEAEPAPKPDPKPRRPAPAPEKISVNDIKPLADWLPDAGAVVRGLGTAAETVTDQWYYVATFFNYVRSHPLFILLLIIMFFLLMRFGLVLSSLYIEKIQLEGALDSLHNKPGIANQGRNAIVKAMHLQFMISSVDSIDASDLIINESYDQTEVIADYEARKLFYQNMGVFLKDRKKVVLPRDPNAPPVEEPLIRRLPDPEDYIDHSELNNL